uniref:RNA-dependent RNA polymerase n=1 Tax=Green Sichuan pepper enamovirus TaxID=2802551 RepID=A0A8F3EY38_9VIRU|nr:RNA-dependent RNA polymerase [Green Sichuan pepper enamovirus]
MLKLIAALLLAIFLSGLWQTSLSSASHTPNLVSNETEWSMRGFQHFSWSPTSFSCASDILEPWESSRAPPELKALLTSWTHPACAVWLTSETGSWSLLVNASMCLSRPLEALTSVRGTLTSSLESFLIYMGGLLEIMLTNCFVALLGCIEISIGIFELLWRSYVLAVIYISWLLLKARPLMTATLVGTLCLFSWADGTHPFRFFLRLLMSPIRILGENFKSIVRLQKMVVTQIMNLILMLLLLPLKVLNLKHQETWGVERLVEGWPKMFIFADPPKGCIAEVLNEDFERVGFCSCVRTLASQEIVLLIPHHLTYGVTEIRVGNRSMKFSDFKVVYSDVKGDAVMLAGPPGWNSKLGMRPRKLIPMSGLRRGKATLFFPGAPAWQAQAAQIKGVYKGFVRGTYHTLHGYSGLPLFNDALDIVAMHVGHYGDELTDNRATVVADLPGITILPFEMESIHMETRVLTGIDAVDQAAENYLSRPIKVGGKTINLEMSDYSYKKITSSALPVLGGVAWADDEELNDPDLWMYAERKEVSGKRPAPGGSPGKTKNSPSRKRRRRKAKRGRSSSSQEEEQKVAREEEGTKESRRGGNSGGGGNPSSTHGPPPCDKQSRAGGSSGRGTQNARAARFCGRSARLQQDRAAYRFCCERGDADTATSSAQISATEKTALEVHFGAHYHWGRETTHSHKVPPAGFEWAGSCCSRYHTSKPRKISNWGFAKLASSPWLAEFTQGFGWPRVGPQAELESLYFQAGRRYTAILNSTVPSRAERDEVIRQTLANYWSVRELCPDWIRSGFNEVGAYAYFLECANAVELSAGAGVPYASWNNRKTHRHWLENSQARVAIFELVVARLRRLSSYNFTTPVQAVIDGVVDPVRIFVKGEAHKIAKIQEGRFRLIASVSLVDQLVARMLFQNQNKRELRAYPLIPSQPGLGLTTDDQVEEFMLRLAFISGCPPDELTSRWSEFIVPTDCSGFDWSVPEWLLEDDLEVRNLLTLQIHPDLLRMRENWLKCLSSSVFCLSDGTLLTQTFPGIQKSGSYNTSSSNSRMRYMLSLHAGAPWCLAMGDDALEGVGTNLAKYAELGFKCLPADKLEFCSQVFRGLRTAVPVNAGRMVFNLLSGINPDSPTTEERTRFLVSACSVIQELRHLPPSTIHNIRCALGLYEFQGTNIV